MSNRRYKDVFTIHPRALYELGGEAPCLAALEVARDLRSGALSPKNYRQDTVCGSACCIAGHIALRLGVNQEIFIVEADKRSDRRLMRCLGLFAGNHPSDPFLAADAIERYVYEGVERKWE